MTEPRYPPGTVNGRLLEAILRHRHFVLRVENGVIRSLLGPLSDARREILATLTELAAKEDALTDFQRMRRLRLMELERRIEAALSSTLQQTLNLAFRDFEAVALREIEVQAKLLLREIPEGIVLDLTGPAASRVEAILNSPLGGERWAVRMERNYRGMTTAMKRSLGTSITLGEGIGPASARLGEVLTTMGRHRTTLLVRSEIQRVANTTALETYRANDSVVKGVQIVETLDDRTCLICAERDGKVLPLGSASHEFPPFHAGCRGFSSPVTKSFAEMGFDLTDVPPSTRASMDGQVPETLKYPEWFGRQGVRFQREMLGPERFRLFQSGALDITDMVKDGRVLRLDELPAMSLGAA